MGVCPVEAVNRLSPTAAGSSAPLEIVPTPLAATRLFPAHGFPSGGGQWNAVWAPRKVKRGKSGSARRDHADRDDVRVVVLLVPDRGREVPQQQQRNVVLRGFNRVVLL